MPMYDFLVSQTLKTWGKAYERDLKRKKKQEQD